MLILLSDLLLVGLSTDTLDHFIGQFAAAVLTHQSVVTMPCFFLLVKLLYQLIESSRRSDVAGIAVTTVGLTPVIPAMNKLLQHAATLSTSQPDHFAKVDGVSSVAKIFSGVLWNSSLSQTIKTDFFLL